jgi:hypothetical protein
MRKRVRRFRVPCVREMVGGERTTKVTRTMERRKFLIASGALAAGGAAAVGSGAFTSVEADRGITVDVESDDNAFLRLGPSDDPNGEYVDASGDLVEIDFTETNEGGQGVNDEAFNIFESVLEVQNQGTQSVRVGVQIEGIAEDGQSETQVFLSRNNLDYNSGSSSEGGQGLRLDDNTAGKSLSDLPQIGPGEGLTIGFAFDTNGDTDHDDIDGDMTIVAGTDDSFPVDLP